MEMDHGENSSMTFVYYDFIFILFIYCLDLTYFAWSIFSLTVPGSSVLFLLFNGKITALYNGKMPDKMPLLEVVVYKYYNIS